MESGPIDLLRDNPVAFALLAVALVFALALHEYAHALAADLQGDRMPRAMGRLTLNPVKHLDPLGTLLIFLVGFGWAKPVQFRPQALSSKRFGAAVVALAGPMMNLALAFVAAVVFVALEGAGAPTTVLQFLGLFFSINVALAVFNLLPLPPLDGSRLLTIFLPPERQGIIYWLDRYGFLVLLALVLLGGFTFLGDIIDRVAEVVFRLAGGGSLLER